MKRELIISALVVASVASHADEVDYSKGIFFINEDWYGHQNSTVNYLLPDDAAGEYWRYRVIQAENPGVELGCTNQYGAIWNGRLYMIAKQDKDPGASIAGGRITVADAATMKVVKQLRQIDPSGRQCDGRAFCGIDEGKGYVSTSNGIWILNLETLEIEGMVEGSSNPNMGEGDGNPDSNSPSSLYYGQTGTMILAEGRVFAVHQQYGMLVIDPVADRVTAVLDMEIIDEAIERDSGTRPQQPSGIGSTVVRSKDGRLWYTAAKNVQGTGAGVPYLISLDPVSLQREVIRIEGDGIYPPPNSWYAWTPDPFCASSVSNRLYWSGSSNSWFSNDYIFRYDIDSGKVEKICDFAQETGDWHLYGCSLGIHPVTDELYASMYHKFVDPTYVTRRLDADGKLIKEYPMISNYWFPSMPVFPEGAGSSGIDVIATEPEQSEGRLYSISGRLVRESVGYGDWEGISSGIYIWKSATSSRKIVIR